MDVVRVGRLECSKRRFTYQSAPGLGSEISKSPEESIIYPNKIGRGVTFAFFSLSRRYY
jgi:hypothetical protein